MLCTFVSYVWSMVSKATIIVNYIAHPRIPEILSPKACTHYGCLKYVE